MLTEMAPLPKLAFDENSRGIGTSSDKLALFNSSSGLLARNIVCRRHPNAMAHSVGSLRMLLAASRSFSELMASWIAHFEAHFTADQKSNASHHFH